jgi:hypothetical protein
VLCLLGASHILVYNELMTGNGYPF